ncbi:MAG: hypothetical protein COX48_01415 [bacterium (Candidatus Stahlbacteria) CG23_combo_of_CG06-09_8_20_14_all_34_7]|nr:MAG: hypothetical protein COX48_01415 [bacterium (Candidatus Stahlbacteria) CG23_combo_of_CG06-09_8_20_14_all_34_7]
MTKKDNKIRSHTPFFNITHTLRGQWSPLGFLLILIFSLSVFANGNRTDATSYYGYKDENTNGVNDIYYDINGDGMNDLNDEAISKGLIFEDKDEDGINDLFCDIDGDGVNDVYLMSKYTPVIDNDKDGINDITGLKYKKGFYNGYVLGLSIEEKGIWLDDYKDDNKDMGDDDMRNDFSINRMDSFIDEDGDGICDSRKNKMNMRQYRTIFRRNNKKGRNQ